MRNVSSLRDIRIPAAYAYTREGLDNMGLSSYIQAMDTASLRLCHHLELVASAADPSPQRGGLPLYLSPVEAGFPSPADDYVEKKLDLHDYMVRNEAATFFLRAHGESMLGAGIHNGDLLVVDRSLTAGHNRVVIAALDGELTVKRLVLRHNRAYLVPENPDYTEVDITEREHLHIWGVVSYVVHKL